MPEATAKHRAEHLLGSVHTYGSQGLDPDPPQSVVTAVKRRVRPRDVLSSLPVVRVIAARDLKAQYKQSVLGPVWLFVQPLGLMLAFTVAFAGVAQVNTGGVAYIPFALVGLIVYSYFQASLITGTNAVITNMTLIRRAPAPRVAFPLASMISALPVLCLTFIFALGAALLSGETPTPRLALLALALPWLFVFTWSVVSLFNALSTRFRDVLYALPFLVQILLFVSPVAYPVEEATPRLQSVLELNPLTGLIEFFRWAILPVQDVNEFAIAVAGVWTVLLVILGWQVFTRIEPTMADYV
jgi:lipopolysaccharide transport system permease protein